MDEELAAVPVQHVIGICMNCIDPVTKEYGVKRKVTKTGRCSDCGSAHVHTPGAIKEWQRLLSLYEGGEKVAGESLRGLEAGTRTDDSGRSGDREPASGGSEERGPRERNGVFDPCDLELGDDNTPSSEGGGI